MISFKVNICILRLYISIWVLLWLLSKHFVLLYFHYSLFISESFLILIAIYFFLPKIICELLNFQAFWKCFSCLFLADFWFDSTIAEEYALYDFSHLKFVETCFMPQKIVSSNDYVMWIEKNVFINHVIKTWRQFIEFAEAMLLVSQAGFGVRQSGFKVDSSQGTICSSLATMPVSPGQSQFKPTFLAWLLWWPFSLKKYPGLDVPSWLFTTMLDCLSRYSVILSLWIFLPHLPSIRCRFLQPTSCSYTEGH